MKPKNAIITNLGKACLEAATYQGQIDLKNDIQINITAFGKFENGNAEQPSENQIDKVRELTRAIAEILNCFE